MEKRQSLLQVVLGKLDSYMQKIKLDHSLVAFTEINSKWIKDLIISPEAIKILEEKVIDISFGGGFLH